MAMVGGNMALMREVFVVMGQFCILAVMVTQIDTLQAERAHAHTWTMVCVRLVK